MKVRSQSSSIPTKRSRPAKPTPGKEESAWTCAGVLREMSGISTPMLHKFAKKIGRNHDLAKDLWKSGIHEAKILAALIGEPEKVTSTEMDRWARAFDSWGVVDATCCYLYTYSVFAWEKVHVWSNRPELYIKRAGFSLVAYLSYKDKLAPDAKFVDFLRVIECQSEDERPSVKKAVNWALRNIGKRNRRLNRAAIRVAEKLRRRDSRAARWIAADALRELRSEAVQQRLVRKSA